MRHKSYSKQFIAALKDFLRDLESVKTVRADDPELVRVKEHIRAKIAAAENYEQQINDVPPSAGSQPSPPAKPARCVT